MIEKILNKVKQYNVSIDSIVVEQENKIVEKEINNTELHELRSCAKIITGLAVGIAISENKKLKYSDEILSLDTKIYSTLKRLVDFELPDYVKKWTIKTLLTHSTGFETMMFNESHLKELGEVNLLEFLFKQKILFEQIKLLHTAI